MAGCVNATVKRVKPTGLDSPFDRAAADSHRQQLTTGHNAVLPSCESRNGAFALYPLRWIRGAALAFSTHTVEKAQAPPRSPLRDDPAGTAARLRGHVRHL